MVADYQLVLIQQIPAPVGMLIGWLSDIGRIACRAIDWKSVSGAAVPKCGADLIVTLAHTDSMETLRLFDWFRENPSPVPKLTVLPADADTGLLRACACVSDDFLLSPLRRGEFCHRAARLLGISPAEEDRPEERLARLLGLEQLVGRDPAFLHAARMIPRIAESDVPVIITGETGTGKELCARAIHHLSRRRNYPFVAVDCSTLPDHLFENELFGHARGAYTDAHAEHKGLISTADGGTLMLDEIDSLSVTSQAKLLRFLQERSYRPLGSGNMVGSDVRVIAASNQALETCVRDKTFRNDLYYRLNVVRLNVPPLRERPGDIGLLAEHFLQCFRRPEQPPKKLAPATLAKLKMYAWPGNVRELSNLIQRALWFSEGPDILPRDIVLPGTTPPAAGASCSFRQGRAETIASFERNSVEELLRKHNGNVTRAAMEAGKERRAFGRLIKKYQISRIPA